jgi:acetylornithine aminotransferase
MEKDKHWKLGEGLIARALQEDERISDAKKLIKDAIASHQKNIVGIKAPIATLKQSYEDMLKAMADYRGGKLWFPYIGSGIGKGPLVELADGSVKYDFITGIGVHFFGHSHPYLIDASIDAAISNTIMQGHLQQNIDSVQLSELLIQASGLPHCFLTTSGAMANENAFKIAFQKHYPAYRIFAFEHCFADK